MAEHGALEYSNHALVGLSFRFVRKARQIKGLQPLCLPLSEGHILKKAVTTLGVIRPEVNLLYESSRNLFLSVSLHSNQADINVLIAISIISRTMCLAIYAFSDSPLRFALSYAQPILAARPPGQIFNRSFMTARKNQIRGPG